MKSNNKHNFHLNKIQSTNTCQQIITITHLTSLKWTYRYFNNYLTKIKEITKNINFIITHLELTCTRQKNWKVWNFFSSTRPHSCSSLAEQKKYFLQTYTGDSLSCSLCLRWGVEDLDFAFFLIFFFQFFLASTLTLPSSSFFF